METKIIIFETGKEEGIMSTNPKFYSKETTIEEIQKQFLKVRKNVVKKHNIDAKKIVMAHQKNDNNLLEYKDGKYIVIKEEYFTKNDYWYIDLQTDILILPEKIKNIIVGHQMSDCPILIIEDRKLGVTAISHCGAAYINRYLPRQTVEALEKEYGSQPENLYVYIGSHIHKENYIYDTYPKWATNENVWKNNIIKKEKGYHIDMTSAIITQLKPKGIYNIKVSKYNTATCEKYYSHYEATRGNNNKLGQNFVGFYYK